MPPKAAQSSSVGDVTTLFSSLATTAAATVRSGTQTLSKTLQDKQVAEVMSANAKVIQEKAAQAAQVREQQKQDRNGLEYGGGWNREFFFPF